ncbi:MAG: TlpA family protein disulfide reductase, partial [Mycobacterium sp.]
MSTTSRWTVVVLIVFGVLGVAFWRQLGDDHLPDPSGAAGSAAGQQTAARGHRDADTPEALAG